MKRLCVNHISKVALVALVSSVLDFELPRAVELMTTEMDDVFGSSWRANFVCSILCDEMFVAIDKRVIVLVLDQNLIPLYTAVSFEIHTA